MVHPLHDLALVGPILGGSGLRLDAAFAEFVARRLEIPSQDRVAIALLHPHVRHRDDDRGAGRDIAGHLHDDVAGTARTVDRRLRRDRRRRAGDDHRRQRDDQ